MVFWRVGFKWQLSVRRVLAKSYRFEASAQIGGFKPLQ
ncbi:hypothetical protein GS8_2457 [Geobacillus stearothermophilus]|uniref:Uncharacterized protein n=1 Tax=Geobacillus stearothermophilus TaxID=1422 RepID=A0ABQ7HDN5_GEOSE|nr:hypothetical protein GS8_2457 [Geobacillus stearothermophilus]